MSRSILWASVLYCLASCPAAYGESDTDKSKSVEVDKLSQALKAFETSSFQNIKSDRCIGVDGASTANGALLKQFSCDRAPNQSWRLLRTGLTYNFIDVKSNKCMGVDHASVNSGANLGQYTCGAGGGAPNQTWILEAVGGTTQNPVVVIHNVKSRGCIGVDRASKANGAQLKQFRCDGAVNQQWRLIER
jgi:hypothetical protein